MGANTDTVLRAYPVILDVWQRICAGEPAGIDQLSGLYSDDVVVDEIREFPDARAYRGYDGLARWLGAFAELYDDLGIEVVGEPEEIGDRVIVPTHQWFISKAGVRTEQHIVQVFTFRDRLITHMTGFRDADAAREFAAAP